MERINRDHERFNTLANGAFPRHLPLQDDFQKKIFRNKKLMNR